MTGSDPCAVTPAEYVARAARVQARMQSASLGALLLTTEADIRYLTGFLTRFWESPTRPWFLVLPASGPPVAVIPAIGAHLMGQTWIEDIRTWRAPDPADDGISLLAEALTQVCTRSDRIGVPDGMESHLRMPLAGFRELQDRLAPRRIVSDDGILRGIRMIKSQAEIARIEAACQIADRAFARVTEIVRPGAPLSEVFRKFQILCLSEGADWVPYLAGAAGQGGYGDVISPASDHPLEPGDVLMLDTGLVRAGYFCDFDRNFSVGQPSAEVASAHDRLIAAVEAGFAAARPGAAVGEVFDAMNRIVAPGGDGSDVGRLGHGLGMQLTEWPSIMAGERTVLEPGMVLTLEPGIALAPGRMMVHEENIVITRTGARFLSDFRSSGIRVLR